MALCALFLSIVGLAACGEGVADNAVVQVGKTPIATATIEHWMSVIASEVSTSPGQPEPQVPDAPRYRACVAYRRKFPTTLANRQLSPAPGSLRHECELELQREKLKALYFLIGFDWVIDEAAELGVKVTDKTLEQQLALLKQKSPSEAALRRLLVGTRGTAQDLRLRLALNVLTTEIQRKLEGDSAKKHLSLLQRQQALHIFGERFARRWIARTSCRPGYVVPICRQYKPPNAAPALTPPSIPLTNLTAE